MFKIYTQYVNNYDSVYEKFVTYQKKKEFKTFVQEAKSSPRHTQLDLLSYLIMPIQRVPRYVMLLSDLLKHTDQAHPDYKNLKNAVEKVEGVARFINEKVPPHPSLSAFVLSSSFSIISGFEQKREDENSKKLVTISKSIDGQFEEPLVQPARRFVREGELELVKVLIKVPTQASPIMKEKERGFSLFRKKGMSPPFARLCCVNRMFRLFSRQNSEGRFSSKGG